MISETVKVFFVVLCLFSGSAGLANAGPAAESLIDAAMRECDLGRIAQDRTSRVMHFEKGQGFGEQAVAVDDQSAAAHFALFCNIGELMRIDGEISISSVFGFRRMMNELERTLELAPDHLDALSAKGTFLVRLPSLLGGNADEGEQLLHYVIRKEPQAVNARLSLARSFCSRGRHHDAVALASEALTIAQAQHRQDLIPEATRIITQLRANASKAN